MDAVLLPLICGLPLKCSVGREALGHSQWATS